MRHRRAQRLSRSASSIIAGLDCAWPMERPPIARRNGSRRLGRHGWGPITLRLAICILAIPRKTCPITPDQSRLARYLASPAAECLAGLANLFSTRIYCGSDFASARAGSLGQLERYARSCSPLILFRPDCSPSCAAESTKC